MIYSTKKSEETQALAQVLGAAHPSVLLWLLQGDLGTGKTTFVQGYAAAHGIPVTQVKSPTFALLNEYDGWVHVDAYRLEAEDAFLLEQIQEYMERGFMVLVEWPERLPSLMKQRPCLYLKFSHQGQDLRTIESNLLL